VEAEDRLLRETGLEAADNSYFGTDIRKAQLEKVLAKNAGPDAPLDHNIRIDPTQVNRPALFSHTDRVLFDHGQSGTVGAVAWSSTFGAAAATSTAGLTGKPVGRLGDTPVIGASIWAHPETLAVSATGTGERIMSAVAVYDIHARMKYKGDDLKTGLKGHWTRCRLDHVYVYGCEDGRDCDGCEHRRDVSGCERSGRECGGWDLEVVGSSPDCVALVLSS
jgi:beta-aspartyl-peptidase (threonine type)